VIRAYVLIQTQVGNAASVSRAVALVDGVTQADIVTGPYDVIARVEAENIDDLGRLVVARMQAVDGVTRALTCPVLDL
jgi:DNA-binding Lrp family transcriptional regulator